jgi:amino acid adenylation domain-containing protein
VSSVETSPAQQGVWFTEQVGGAGTAYHMPLAIWLEGELNVRALVDACDAVVARHPALAAAVEDRDGVPHLVAARERPRVEAAAEAPGELIRRETLRPFDLRRGPLARLTLGEMAPGRWLLLVVAHHVVFDGGSKDVLVRDLAACYAAFVAGEAPALPALPRASAERLTEDRLIAARAFWADRWPAPEEVVLPGLSHAGRRAAPGESLDMVLDEALLPDLGASRFELLLAALQALLRRYGSEEVTLAVDLGTRTEATHDHVGLFVNELPLTARPSPRTTFRELLAATRAELRELYGVRDVPLARAVGGLGPRVALASVSLSYRRRSVCPAFPGLAASVDWMMFNGTARNALHVQAVDGPEGLALSLQHSPAAIARPYVERIAGHLETLLAGVAADPDARLGELPVLGDGERRQVLVEWNAPAAARPAVTLPRLFEARAASSPGAVALVFEGRELTYAGLNGAANRVAHRLLRAGAGPGTLVAVCAERSPEMVVGLLGVLKAGAAYLPLDPGHPPDRLAFTLADAGVRLLLAQERLLARLPDGGASALPLDRPEAFAALSEVDPAPPEGPGDLAYVIYTSGSTGRPKGVEIEHRSLLNVLLAVGEVLGAGAGDAWLGLTAPSFDISALELFLPLLSGGRVVLSGERDARDGAALLRLVRERGVTHVQATPSGWRLLLAAGFDDRSVVALCGGEPLPPPLARDLAPRAARLLNMYGPTETTVWSTMAEVGEGVTIGRPLAGTRVVAVDEEGEPVPAGVPGELCIGGAGVARGYRGRPALTAERFVPDPFGAPGERWYRTGDRGRRRLDGEIEFMGRTDHQVKVRGHRVELGEIETVLMEHPGVARAAVLLREEEDGDQRLVAYVVAARGGTPGPAELREHLARTLPEHMVPGVFVALERVPLTANGKLDRGALPEPPRRRDPDGEEPAVASGLTRDVGEICREVMRLDDLQPDEDLFELGGHSLTMTLIASRIRKRLRREVPLNVFFDTPTVAGIVHALTRTTPT